MQACECLRVYESVRNGQMCCCHPIFALRHGSRAIDTRKVRDHVRGPVSTDPLGPSQSLWHTILVFSVTKDGGCTSMAILSILHALASFLGEALRCVLSPAQEEAIQTFLVPVATSQRRGFSLPFRAVVPQALSYRAICCCLLASLLGPFFTTLRMCTLCLVCCCAAGSAPRDVLCE